MQPKADPDELFVLNMLDTGPRITPFLRTLSELASNILREDGAVERLVEKHRDALLRDNSDLNALIEFLIYFHFYLEIELPDKLDLFQQPLNLLFSALEQVRKGSLPAVLSSKVHSRPRDSLYKQLFKIGCVIAGDLHFEADKEAGLERRFLKRSEADAIICRQPNVRKGAARFGLSPTPTTIKGWRREAREAHTDSDLKFLEEELRAAAKRVLEMRGLQEAVKYLLDAYADEQFALA